MNGPKASSTIMALLVLAALTFAGTAAHAAAPDADIKGLWLEIPGFPKNIETETRTDTEGMTTIMARIEEGFTLTLVRRPNPNNTLTTKNAATILAGFSGVAEDEIDVAVPDKDDVPCPAARKYPFAMAEYNSGGEGKEAINAAMFFFPQDFFFLVHMRADSEEIIEKHQGDIERWCKSMKFVEK